MDSMVKKAFQRLILRRTLTYFVCCSALLVAACDDNSKHSTANRNIDGSSDDQLPPAALTLQVTSTDDSVDTDPGDGVCVSASHHCTLRAAIMEANTFSGGLVRVNIPSGRYLLGLPSPAVGGNQDDSGGPLLLKSNIHLLGAGANHTVIDAGGSGRVIHIERNGDVLIEHLAVTGGGNSGIYNVGAMVLRYLDIYGNQGQAGGGIFNVPYLTSPPFTDAPATIIASTIRDNVVSSSGAGIRFDGAGIVINSTISGNRIVAECCGVTAYDGSPQGEGGGIDARGLGEVTIINSTITDNYAPAGGAGVNVANSYTGLPRPGAGPMVLVNSIVANNQSEQGPRNCKNTGVELLTEGGNISDDDSCPFTHDNDLAPADTLLMPLARSTGTLPVHMPLPASPVIDAVEAGDTRCPSLDQLGRQRPRDGSGDGISRCDSGAIELPE